MSRHMGLCRSYASALCPVYLEELRDSCERCKSVCAVKGKGNSSRRDLQTRLQFDTAFGELLGEVIPPRLAEQEFCANFFMSTETTAPVVDESQTETRRRRMQTTSGAHREIENLVEIFQGLDTELVELISTIEKVDPFFSVVAMARVHTIMPYPNTMIATYLKNIRAAVMTKFDAYEWPDSFSNSQFCDLQLKATSPNAGSWQDGSKTFERLKCPKRKSLVFFKSTNNLRPPLKRWRK